MTITQQAVNKCYIGAEFVLPSVTPIVDEVEASIPLLFSGVSNLRRFTGSYTPNNDYIYIVNGLALPNTFNFIFAICDAQMNVTCSFGKSNMNLPIQRFAFLSWVLDPANFVSGLFIDGRLNPNPGNSPMPQGAAMGYTIILGQATVT